MSVIAANGRHEDDLIAEAYQNDDTVSIDSLLDHARGILADPQCGFGVEVWAPVRSLLEVLEHLSNEAPGALPERVTLKAHR